MSCMYTTPVSATLHKELYQLFLQKASFLTNKIQIFRRLTQSTSTSKIVQFISVYVYNAQN